MGCMDWWYRSTRQVYFFRCTRSKGKTIRGSKRVITDGPFTEGKELVSGYLLMEAESMDEAVELSYELPRSMIMEATSSTPYPSLLVGNFHQINETCAHLFRHESEKMCALF
ncbi:MAG: hypothetical protein IPO48_20380 [Saprospiraceae bacterium]|nr:hypothetical protein [Saprospiraceae bacterium]